MALPVVVRPPCSGPRFRFAPSPNGYLHLGHAYSALMNQQCATRRGGTVLLRMEDIDGERCTPAFERAMTDDLAWLGFDWHGAVMRQSERFGIYSAALDSLDRRHLLYPCFCSRGDIARAIGAHTHWPRDPDGSPLYPGTCRRLGPSERAARRAAGVPAALRLDMERALEQWPAPISWQEYREGESAASIAAEPRLWGDVLLARKDIPTSYHVAVVVDDEAQGITDVVRGEDLFQATGLHCLLQLLWGFGQPAYHHHHLVTDATGRKLSKSRNAPSLRELRQAGISPATLRQQLELAA